MGKNIADTTLNDVKDAAEEKVNDARETVEDAAEAAEGAVNRLSTIKKAALGASIVIVGYAVVSNVVKRVLSRNDEVIEGDVIVVTEAEVLDAED